ncbi:hypothetical protein [Streptomyces atratus]|uniref:hypothetical protein n=1 Tax=Streptomyces atratus TaxID=1893 RepID=UPI002F908A3C
MTNRQYNHTFGSQFWPNSGRAAQGSVADLGTALFLNHTPIGDIFTLPGGCGAIGAGALAAAGGGRRLMAVFIETAVRSGAGKQGRAVPSSRPGCPLPPFAGLAGHHVALRRAARLSQRGLAVAAAV